MVQGRSINTSRQLCFIGDGGDLEPCARMVRSEYVNIYIIRKKLLHKIFESFQFLEYLKIITKITPSQIFADPPLL